jgi:hypothetical protein
MNLAPVRIKHAHGDGTRWPIRVGDELERARYAPHVRCHFAKDVSPGVKELDSILHGHKNKLIHSPVPSLASPHTVGDVMRLSGQALRTLRALRSVGVS